MPLTDWIMRTATEDPPHGREHWAEAMRAEYATLDRGKLSWALGCWTTMLGWRMRADAIYFAALVAMIPLYLSGLYRSFTVLLAPAAITLDLSTGLIFMLLAAIGLNLLQPRRGFLSGVTLIAMQNLYWVTHAWYIAWKWPQYATNPDGPLHIYSAPPFVAHLAEIGVCCLGAVIGAWISNRLRSTSSVSA